MADRLLGCFRLGRELGAGGMGKVHEATVVGRCPGLDEGARVALKIVHPHLLDQPGFFRRFLREAEIGASVRHPNVVRTYLADALGTEHFLVMEYVEGQNLRDLLVELDKVPEELCRHIGREVAKGLAAIHDAGVVHRDLKPENVLITPEHEVKVMDLGVARLQDETVRLSQTGAFVGSLHYAAPEAFADGGADVDGRADLHALGLLLYELASGSNPYVADTVPKMVHNVLHAEPRRLGDANPQLSPFFEEVVHCLLAKDREHRFTSAPELLTILEAGEDSTWWVQRASMLRRSTRQPLRRIRIPRETAVYGRENDLARLRALYDRATTGEGQVVLIEGEAGIGKSRLVDELIARLQQDGEDLSFLFGSYPPGGAALAAGGFSAAYREQLGSDGSAPYLSDTPLLVPGFDAVLRGEPTPTGALGLTEDSLQTCFVHVTHALALERPTVVLIDDLHFAPESARALFTSLSRAVPGHRVLLLGTTRPGVPEEWVANLTRPEHVSHLKVDRLGPKDLVRLLQDSFRSERLAEELGARIALKSDGNPFFAFEIIRGLREGRFVTQHADGTWVGTRVIDDLRIPSSVLDLVNARIADLSDEDKDLLEIASCWGYEFDPTLVAEAAGVPIVPALKRLGRLEKAHRIVRASGRSMVFDHHQVQETLYAGILEQLREHYHAVLARALESRTEAREREPEDLDGALCVNLCEHYLKGARGPDGVRYLRTALGHLLAGYVHSQAVDLAERALQDTDALTGIERVRVLIRLGYALDATGDAARGTECALEARRLAESAGDDHVLLNTMIGLGDALLTSRGPDEAEPHYREALRLTSQVDCINCRLWAMQGLERVLSHRGEFAAQVRQVEARLRLAHEHGREDWLGSVNLGNALYGLGRLVQAQERFRDSVELFARLGTPWNEAAAHSGMGDVLEQLGRLADAQSHRERALALCKAAGYRRREVLSLVSLAAVLWERGETVPALSLLRDAARLSEQLGYDHGVAGSQLALGRILATSGDVVGAHGCFVSARDAAAASADVRHEALSRCWLASLPDGDPRDADAAFESFGERLSAAECREARLMLWSASGNRSHLIAARRLLDDLLDNVPREYHEAMRTNVRVNREILAACEEHGL